MEKKALVMGVIGADVHAIGNKILEYALKQAGFNIVNLGVMVSQQEYIKAAIETAADAILVSSLYGHGETVEIKELEKYSGLSSHTIMDHVQKVTRYPETLSNHNQEATLIDDSLASLAVKYAVERHVGNIETVYTPFGVTYLQTGKDVNGLAKVIGTRPNIFGPQPQDIADIVFKSIRYRKMEHTAEDLTSKVLEQEYGLTHPPDHGDVKHGFVLEFSEKPDIDICEVEKKVLDYIENEIDICYLDDNHIRIGYL